MKRVFIITGITFLLIAVLSGIFGMRFQKQSNRATTQAGYGYIDDSGKVHIADMSTYTNRTSEKDSKTAAGICYVCAVISIIMGIVFLILGVIDSTSKEKSTKNYKSIYEDKNLKI